MTEGRKITWNSHAVRAVIWAWHCDCLMFAKPESSFLFWPALSLPSLVQDVSSFRVLAFVVNINTARIRWQNTEPPRIHILSFCLHKVFALFLGLLPFCLVHLLIVSPVALRPPVRRRFRVYYPSTGVTFHETFFFEAASALAS